MAKTYRLGLTRRLVNVVMKGLHHVGVAGGHTYLLSVSGRRTGKTYSTPVILVESGERWLVAPYGEVGWVRNVRAAGRATLSRGRRRQSRSRLARSARRESTRSFATICARSALFRPFFDASPDSPLEAFEAEADRHPVFRVESG